MKSTRNAGPLKIPHNRGARSANNFEVVTLTSSDLALKFEEDQQQDYFKIIWLNYGKGIHQIDMIDHSYDGSVLFFLAPGQVHKIEEHKKSEGFILKFLPAVFKQEMDFIDYVFDACLIDSEKSCPVIVVPDQMNDIIHELFARFIEEFNAKQPGADIILTSYLKILTTHTRRIKDTYLSKEAYTHKPEYNLFRKYKIALEQHYKELHTVQEYAHLLKTQARNLNGVARKFAGKSALEIIQDRIVLEAKRKLYHETKSIKELGYELGFEDPAYFTRFFKKNVGITPQFFKMDRQGVLNTALS